MERNPGHRRRPADDTGAQAREAGAVVIRHPYNKGNGASLKTGIRRAAGEWILVMDGDGQHHPGDAVRLVSFLGEYDLVIGARSSSTQATATRRWGNDLLNRLAGYLAQRSVPISPPASGRRGAGICSVPPPAAERILVADDDHARVSPRRLQRALRADRRPSAQRPVEDQAGAGRREVLSDPAEGDHDLQSARDLRAAQPRRFRIGVVYGAWTAVQQSRIPNGAVLLLMFAVIVFLVGLVSEQISTLHFAPRQDRS